MAALPRELNPSGALTSGDNTSTALLPTPGDGLGKINPLAGMGLSDAQYAGVLAGMVSGDAFAMDSGTGGLVIVNTNGGDKRGRGGDGEDERDVKRGRFEEVA